MNESGLLADLRRIAEDAGNRILEIYDGLAAPAVRRKADQSPVTAADLAAEAIILPALRAVLPDTPVVSEEAMETGQAPDISGGRFWLVDPLDGTREFLARSGEFTVNIGLIAGGRPVAGVVHAPALRKTWSGAGPNSAVVIEAGAAPAPIRARAVPREGAVIVVSRRHGDSAAVERFLGDVKVKQRLIAGSALKFCLIAAGQADLYPRFGRTMEWDTAAGHAVLAAAGGAVVQAAGGASLGYGKAKFENPSFIARGVSS